MAKVPGLPTYIKRIREQVAAGNLTPEEGANLIEDARFFSRDGKLSSTEKASLDDDITTFSSTNNGAVSGSPNPAPPPLVVVTPAPPPSGSTTGPVEVAAPSPVPLTPIIPAPINNAPTGIKQATPDIIIFDDSSISPDFLTESFFEEFGGTELINISRSDLIDGDQVSYSPIVNLSRIRQSFNPKNIIGIQISQETPTKYGIDLLLRGVKDPIFNENGDLVIEIENIRIDESIEVELVINGTINRTQL